MFRQLSQIALALLLVEAITWRSWPVTPVVVNVRAFGAKGDCQHVVDGVMRQGSPILTSLTATFGNGDVGMPIYVLEAGAQLITGLGMVKGAPLSSKIVAVTDAHTVVLADPAQTTVSGSSVTWGNDDTQAIQRAIDSLNATGGVVFVPGRNVSGYVSGRTEHQSTWLEHSPSGSRSHERAF